MKVLVIPGSARANSVGRHIAGYVEQELAAREGVQVEVATLDDIALPFVDTPVVPAFDGYEITHPVVQAWTDKVAAADAFVFLVPEYNGSITGIQKNALDWVYKQWNGKRAAIVTYNFYDRRSAVEAILPVFKVVQLDVVEPVAGLKIGEEIGPDGTALKPEQISSKIADAITGLLSPARV